MLYSWHVVLARKTSKELSGAEAIEWSRDIKAERYRDSATTMNDDLCNAITFALSEDHQREFYRQYPSSYTQPWLRAVLDAWRASRRDERLAQRAAEKGTCAHCNSLGWMSFRYKCDLYENPMNEEGWKFVDSESLPSYRSNVVCDCAVGLRIIPNQSALTNRLQAKVRMWKERIGE